MKNLLVINSSARASRSITRHLTSRFAEAWKQHRPDAAITLRDVGMRPPSPVNELWIASAFCEPARRIPSMQLSLAESETLISEIESADAIVLGVPMYNFGMPAPLKAWFDQIIRVDRTFAFHPASENPYTPLLASKPVVLILSAGDGSLHIGGALEHLNFLEPHLLTVFGFIGMENISVIRAGYDEYQDDRAKRSLSAAEGEVDAWVKMVFQEGGPENVAA